MKKADDADFVYPKMSQKSMDKILDDIANQKKIKTDYYIATSKPEEVNKKLNTVQACGGMVTNEDGDLLLIFRNGMWDLPKGKREKGEKKKETALREVSEETKVKHLKVGNKIGKTYHWYNRGKWLLKESVWYRMSTHTQKPKPQKEEGIQKAVWATRSQVKKHCKNMYPNIRVLIEEHYL